MAKFSFIRLHILPALFMFLVAAKPLSAAETTTKSTTTTGAGGNNAKESANVGVKSPRSEIVTYEKWNCGSGDFDKYLSHQLSMEECPKRMYEADLCCVVHDICYMDEKNSQQDCDVAFCHCLDRTVAQAARAINQSSATGCQTVSNSFCEIVKMFGGIAYATSKRLADRQKIAIEALEQMEAAAKKNGTNNGTSSSATSTGTTTPSILSPSSSAISSSSSSAIPLPISSTSTSPSSSSSSIGSSPSSSSSSNAPSSTASPAEIGHFVTHKFPLNCFDDVLSECTKKLQQCTSRHFTAAADGNEVRGDALVLTSQLAECSAQFCECTAAAQHGEGKQQGQKQPARTESARWTLAKLAAQKEDECAKSLASICAQFADIPMPPGAGNVNFWSINVNYIGQPISLAIAMIGSLLLMFALVAFGFLLFNLVNFVKRRLQMDESIRKNYAKSSIRRNTLTALRNVSGAANGDDDDAGERGGGGGGGPHYMPFGHGQKESTASSPSESEPAAQKLLGHGSAVHHHHHHNHHKKAHSDVMAANKNLLHSPHQHNNANNNNNNMPLNSSQVHLIAGTGNSSSTLSDISSS